MCHVASRRATRTAFLTGLLLLALAPQATAAPGVSISPKTQTVSKQRGVGESESFVVTNTGNSSGSFTVTYTCSTILGCSPSPLTNTLAAGATWTVTIPFTATATGTGTITVTASTTGASDQAVTTVNVFAPGVTVAPATRTVTKAPNSVQTDTFTVTNTGGGRSYYTTSVDCSGTLTSCSVSPSGFFIDQGAQKVVVATYTTGAAGTTGSLSFTTYTTGANSTGTINVTSASGAAGVTVTPKGTTVTWPAWTFPSQSFTVTNTGSASASFTIVKSCTGWIIECSNLATTTQTIAAGAQYIVSIPIQTHGPPPSTGTIKVVASTSGAADSATVNANVVAPGGSVAISPSSVTKPASAAQSSTFTVNNTGTATSTYTLAVVCTGALTACSVPAPTSVTIAAGGSASVPVNYTTGASGTTGTIQLTASTPNITPNATLTVTAAAATVAVAVTPKGSSTTLGPNTTGNSFTFTVTNSGTATTTFALTGSCASAVTCSAYSNSVSLAAGASTTVPITYATTANNTGANLTGTIKLKAVSGAVADSAIYTVTVTPTPPAVAVTPKGSTASIAVNTTGQSFTFTVANTSTSTAATSFALTGSCAGSVTCSAYSNSASLAGGASTTVPITFATTGTAGTGTIKLKAVGGGVSDSATYTVTVTAAATAGVTVTPKGTTVTWPSWTFPTQTFTVTNTGSAAASFTIVKSCTGWIIECSNLATTTQTIAAGAQYIVSIPIQTHGPPPSTGTIKVVASTSGAADSATVNANVVAPGGSVAISPSSVTKPASSAQQSSFAVTNSGTAASTYALSVTCTAPLTACSVPAPTSITVNAGQSASVPVNYTTGVAGTSGTITLTASTPNITPNATLTVAAANTNGVAVTPKGSTTTLGPSTTGNTFTFTVQNTGSATTTFALTGSCSGAITCSAYSNSISPNAGVSTPIQLTFATSANNTGVNQTGTLTLSASGGGVSDAATYTVTVTPTLTPPSVSVTPATGSVSLNPGQTTTSGFTIRNAGGAAASYSYTVTCPSVVTSCTASSATSSALTGTTGTLQPNATFAVNVTYTGGTTLSSGALALSATDQANGSVSAQGQYTVSVTGSAPITVITRGINPGTTVARDECLSISTGNGTAYECGDLRVVHPLPTTTTYGKGRTPTLIYSSRSAKPSAVIAANVALQSSLTPTTIQGRVTFSNILSPGTTYTTPTSTYTWQGGWSTGGYRRISLPINALSFGPPNTGLPTGAYSYTFQVSATQNGVTSTASDTGTFVIVNRVVSPFGAGWWLAGLEQVIDLDANRILWIGGDGSARMYKRMLTGPGTMYAATENVDRPDTLQKLATCSGCAYTRFLPNKTRIDFDVYGNHIQTVNALGHVTSFGWTSIYLTSLTLPVPNSGITGARAYGFVYSNDTYGVARLSTVTAPTIPGQDRTTFVQAPLGVVEKIRYLASGPYMDSVSFAYRPADVPSAPSARLISSRTNRRGHRTDFAYDSADALKSATIEMSDYNAGSDIVHTFIPAETRGYPTPVRLDSTWTVWDGPRSIADISRFLVNRFGAPDTLIGALNDTTRVYRNANWPALPDSVIKPGGFKTSATYDNTRGLVLTRTQWNPLGDNVNATTTYQWDGTFDKPTQITAPMGDVVLMEYQTDGRMWTKTSGGVRVNFDYRQPPWLAPVCAGATVVYYPNITTDTLAYDWLCNLNWTKTPINPRTTYLRDEIGRVASTRTPIDSAGSFFRVDTTVYDPSDLVLRTRSFSTTGSDSLVATNTYDAEGNLLTATQEAFPHIARRRGGTLINGVWVENPDVGAFTRSFSYDPAGRKLSEGSGVFSWSMAYDPAGNVLQGKDYGPVTRTYDVENRLLTQVGSDNSSFTYDPKTGWLLAADNQNAQVRRGYYPNGAIKEDTLRLIKPFVLGDNTPSEFVTKYTYDRNGRRTTATNHLGRTAQYAYDPVTGNIKSIVDVAGNTHRFAYNSLGQLDSLIRLSGRTDSVIEKNTWDLEGRLRTRYVAQPSGTLSQLYNYELGYDGRNKVVRLKTFGQTTNTATLNYAPLGQLVWSNATNYSGGETYETDALGMHRWHTSLVHVSPNTSATDLADAYVYYTPSTMSVGMTIEDKSTTRPDTTLSNYGDLGNLISTENVTHSSWEPGQPTFDNVTGKKYVGGFERVTIHSYNAENRMVLTDIYVDTVFAGDANSARRYHATEEYKYDALGRRVWVRSLKPLGCLGYDQSSGCHSFDNYTIWDGDQILSEVRVWPPGVSGVEFNTGTGSTGTHYGTIENTHAGVIDQPISVARDNAVVLPYPDWRGLIDRATCATPGTCGLVSFPGSQASMYANYKQGSPNWYGSLTEGQTDASGFQYKRNRYYDSKSGTFTQDDPIGIAGGFNTYAYAEGDPANYSDPFGLCATPETFALCKVAAVTTGSALVTTGKALVTTGAALVTTGKALVATAQIVGEAAESLVGQFSIRDWTGYPEGGTQPSGPFRVVSGEEYGAARGAANKANAAIHRADPSLAGKQIHEIHPVKFGGSPTDASNKVPLPPAEHAKYTTWWNRLLRDIGQ